MRSGKLPWWVQAAFVVGLGGYLVSAVLSGIYVFTKLEWARPAGLIVTFVSAVALFGSRFAAKHFGGTRNVSHRGQSDPARTS